VNVEFSLITIVAVSFVFSYLAGKAHLSKVIGFIIAGLLFSIPAVQEIFVSGHEILLSRLANIGLVTLMFLAGFEVSGNMLFKQEKSVIVLTFLTTTTSLVLGTLVFLALGYALPASLVMGICFGITAEATKARALFQLKKLKTRLGSLLMGTGIINDILGVIFLLVITYFFTNNVDFHEIYILVLVMAAFFAGMTVHYKFDRFSKSIRFVEKLLLFVVVPFFFVNMGINFNIYSLTVNFWLIIIVIITATTGQILGVFFSAPITRLNLKQVFLVGWGMNSKGAVELAIGYIALTIGLLPLELYSALVITALVSTILFQVIIFYMIKKYPKIMK